MKQLNTMIGILLVLGACQPTVDNSASEAFEKNSKVIKAYVDGYVAENIDYEALYADDAIIRGTSFGAPDTLSIEDMKAQDEEFLAAFDLELVTELVLLPGVNVDTKKADGSVRYYGDWKLIIPATDSTEERSVVVKLYESFDFNEEGKIAFQQSYGDISAAFDYLVGGYEDMSEEGMEDEM